MGHLKCECPTLKGKGLFQEECLNSPNGLRRHSQTVQPNIGTDFTTEGKEAESLVEQVDLTHTDLWAKLVGRANEDQIVINGHPVTALLDPGSQIIHVSKAFCLVKGFQINPISQLVDIEGTGGQY